MKSQKIRRKNQTIVKKSDSFLMSPQFKAIDNNIKFNEPNN